MELAFQPMKDGLNLYFKGLVEEPLRYVKADDSYTKLQADWKKRKENKM